MSVAAPSLEVQNPAQSARSLEMVRPKRWTWRIVTLLLFLICTMIVCLIFVPWQQSVNGTGQVFVYSANERPQNIAAQIPGRIKNWQVQEGETVKAGDVIAELEDIEQRFLDPDQPLRLRQRKTALRDQRGEAQNRRKALKDQYNSLLKSREAQVPSAGEVALQAEEQLKQAQQVVKATEKTLDIIREATIPAMIDRLNQAKETVKRDQQALIAAQERQKNAGIQRARITDLFAKQLKSQRENELAQQEYIVCLLYTSDAADE